MNIYYPGSGFYCNSEPMHAQSVVDPFCVRILIALFGLLVISTLILSISQTVILNVRLYLRKLQGFRMRRGYSRLVFN